MKSADEDDYREFVHARLSSLRQTAYLLCHDWHTADDLVSITIGKLYRHWNRARQADHVEAYVRTVLLNSWLSERRRLWRWRERTLEELPERVAPSVAETTSADRSELMGLLAQLPPRRRAVVVLRFYCDLSVEETAATLGISTGAVKSQSARGLESLRTLAAKQPVLADRFPVNSRS